MNMPVYLCFETQERLLKKTNPKVYFWRFYFCHHITLGLYDRLLQKNWIYPLSFSLPDLDPIRSPWVTSKSTRTLNCTAAIQRTLCTVLCRTIPANTIRQVWMMFWSHPHSFCVTLLFDMSISSAKDAWACIGHSGTCCCSHTGSIDGCAFKVAITVCCSWRAFSCWTIVHN